MTDQTTKKLAETDRLATAYLQALYRLVSCLDVGSVAQEEVAHSIICTSANVARFQRRVNHSFSTNFSDECAVSPEPETVELSHESGPLTESEQAELRDLIGKHGFYVAQEDGTDEIIITHDLIQGRARALNEREVYEIVKDTVERIA
jgi:hypothetical protein